MYGNARPLSRLLWLVWQPNIVAVAQPEPGRASGREAGGARNAAVLPHPGVHFLLCSLH